MKVIFLDFDGVLNSMAWMRACADRGDIFEGPVGIDKAAVAVLNKIIEKTGAKVVVSSTWRKGHNIAALQTILDEAGFTGEVIGKTCSLYGEDPRSGRRLERGDEILRWIAEHKTSRFVIIDDSSDMNVLLDKLVRTSWENGLTEAHVPEILKHLEG